MPGPRVLFASGSIGLGHVTRDLSIAAALRKRVPAMRLSFLAADAAGQAVTASGEELLPESVDLTSGVSLLEAVSSDYALNLMNPSYVFRPRVSFRLLKQLLAGARKNVTVFKEVTSRARFDLIIGDETYEILLALVRNPRLRTAPFAMIFDFVGVDSVSRNPLEKAAVHVFNRAWAGLFERAPRPFDLGLFVGEEQDVPDTTFGLGLPNRRESARRALRFLGYVVPFEPGEYADRENVRRRLGYGHEPLVVCSIGGTSVGRALLGLCARACEIARKEIPDLRMILVGGPDVPVDSLPVAPGVEVRGFVPRLFEHFAACDLAVVQGGGTTTLELTALGRPFLYFPLEGHFEQERHVAARLRRHGAGIRMRYRETTPVSLAREIVARIGRDVSCATIPLDGAAKAAELLCRLLPGEEAS